MNIKIRFILFFLISCVFSNANGWEMPFNNSKCFIENRGQFQSSILKAGEKILYAYDEGNTKVYFTNLGVIYSFIGNKKSENTLSEKRQGGKLFFNSVEEYKKFEREEFKHELIIDNVRAEWIGCNNAADVVTEDQTNEHFSYSYYDEGALKNVSNLKGVKKIIYRSIYPGIDLEYVLHEKDGLKYSLILQPLANFSAFKTMYNRPVTIDSKGQVVIPTKFGEIVEHAPLCFYSNNNKEIIRSKFVVNNGALQFQLSNFNSSNAIVIDPWVQLPVLNNSNSVWECERDTLGNVYTIGGEMPLKLQKYNAMGALLWTYNTPFDTTSWLGSIATDAIGNTYISQGSEARIMKVDANGNFMWINTPIPALSDAIEYWSFAFNFDQSRLFVGGTYLKMSPFKMDGMLYEIDTANGQQLNSQTLSTTNAPAFSSEIRAIEMAPNGSLYSLTHDSVFRSEQNFDTLSVVGENSGFRLSYKCENWRYICSGIEAIRANENYLYIHRGEYLTRRSLQNNLLIDSVLIPGGSVSNGPLFGHKMVGASGIDIDECGNVYVGAVNAVVKFDSTLTFIDSIQIPFTVFDLSINLGGEVVAVGSTTQSTGVRTGYVTSLNLLSCKGLDNISCDRQITGNVSSLSNGILSNGANVILYKYSPFYGPFDTIQQCSLDSLGNYNFANVPFGNYIVKVFPDTTYHNLAPAYFRNQDIWDSAEVISHNSCMDSDTANIVLNDLMLLSGSAQLDGYIFEGIGYNRLEGEPISFVDIKLKRNPDQKIIAYTQSDLNGHYSFVNMPFNDGGINGVSYTILVDIPGMRKDSSYSVVLNTGTQALSNLNYLVDSNSIYIMEIVTSSNIQLAKENKFNVYPNPYEGITTVVYTLNADANVRLEVYNVLGVKVQSIVNTNQQKGEFKYNLDTDFSSGVYFVSLTVDGKTSTQRVIKMD